MIKEILKFLSSPSPLEKRGAKDYMFAYFCVGLILFMFFALLFVVTGMATLLGKGTTFGILALVCIIGLPASALLRYYIRRSFWGWDNKK